MTRKDFEERARFETILAEEAGSDLVRTIGVGNSQRKPAASGQAGNARPAEEVNSPQPAGRRIKMTNNQNLKAADLVAIETLTADQLKAVRLNIQSQDYSDAQTREAVMEYVADGGSIQDLLP